MDKPRHPQVIRTWKVERIRKPPSGAQKKHRQGNPGKKSSRLAAAHWRGLQVVVTVERLKQTC
jgi:hypothetical protein